MATINDAFKQIPLPKRTLVVARADGRLYTVDFTQNPHLDDPSMVDWNVSISKMLLGKLQRVRTRFLTLHEVEVEGAIHTEVNVPGTANDTLLTIFPSLNGKASEVGIVPVKVIDDEGMQRYNCHVTAQNFSIMFQGTYNINTMVLTFSDHGRR